MARSTKRVAALCAVLVLAGFGIADMASACNQQCQRVSGGGTLCRQCVDTDQYTGATCDSSGPCSCFYTQNTCGLGLAGIQEQTRQAAASGPACEPLPFAGEVEAEVESLIVMN